MNGGNKIHQSVEWLSGNINRRDLVKRVVAIGLTAPVVGTLLAACETDDTDDETIDDSVGTEIDDDVEIDEPDDDDASEPDQDDEEVVEDDSDDEELQDDEELEDDQDTVGEDSERYGGTITVALVGDPSSLDLHQDSSLLPMYVSMNVMETLFTWDEEFQIAPDLVETHDVSDDGLVNTLNLRQGVEFHNGEEFRAADALASIERWAELVGFGQELLNQVDEIREVDEHTLEFQMTAPYGTFAIILARQNNGCAIYPESVIEEYGTDIISELVGTGPFRFVEHQPDSHILLERFDDFVPRDDEPSGYAGRKTAYADELRFVPVPDEAARVAGLQAGDYNYLQSVSTDQFDVLDDDHNVTAELASPTEFTMCLFNLADGMMTDHTIRQAIQTAVDVEPMLQAMHGDGFYRMNASHMPEETVWYSTVGEDSYNVADPDRARALLEEAGYDGEPVRILTTQEYQHYYNLAIMLQQQLEDIGMTVELDVYDWSSMLEARSNEEAWDIATGALTFRVDPSQLPPMRCEWGGWWCSDEKVELVDRLFSEVEFDDRFEAWEELQELTYDEIPYLKVGEGMVLLAHSSDLHDIGLLQLSPAFWNVWLEQ